MHRPTSIKPEPIKAKSNWSYHAYYSAQLQRIKASNSETSSTVKQPSETGVKIDTEERNRVITKMEELAASIGVQLTIIENPSAASTSSESAECDYLL